MNRRRLLAGAGSVAIAATSGCLSSRSSATGSDSETTDDAATLGVENLTNDTVTLTLSVRNREDATAENAFEQTFELDPDELRQSVFTVRGPSSHEVRATLTTDQERSFTWKVCTGYGSAVVFVDENRGERGLGIRQMHADPEAKNCEL